MITRRRFLASATVALFPQAARAQRVTIPAPPSPLEALSGKVPLVKRTYRPPNYETPLEYFSEAITPNDAFFVRYHLSNIPDIPPEAWRLEIGGDAVDAPYTLDFEALRGFEAVEIVAVCQCLGTSRALGDVTMPALDWGEGAMGGARWKGVRLRDVLQRAKLRSAALEVVLGGADGPPRPTMPDFAKSLPVAKALHPDTLIAYEMNGRPLPRWNGQPVRLVVPGWAGRYWMKQLNSIEVVSRPLLNYWMNGAYRVPIRDFPEMTAFPSQDGPRDKPITDLVLSCVVANLTDGQTLTSGLPFEMRGVAWSAGSGIAAVQISDDRGATWVAAELLEDLGAYAFRPWSYRYTPRGPGAAHLLVRAVDGLGRAQAMRPANSPYGFHHHYVRAIGVQIL